MTGRDRSNERLVALFLLGLLLFLPPLLLVFNRPDRVIGIPALYLYIFVVWAGLIALSALISARIGGEAETPADTAAGADKPLEETRRA
jgi:hypothetical protein